nr:MAG TPA: hypothetical protein [Caudoviricetes sp.]
MLLIYSLVLFFNIFSFRDWYFVISPFIYIFSVFVERRGYVSFLSTF